MTSGTQYDVIVLGTGAAGLTAALRAAHSGARVGLFEKADTVGGTTAWSGGTVWLPDNVHERENGFDDSREDVLRYLSSLSHDLIPMPLIEAYVDTVDDLVAWLEADTPVRFETLMGMSDYHPEHPGGRREGRSVEAPLFPYDELGEWAARVTRGRQINGEFCMSETGLGRKAPDGIPPEEAARRRIRDERGAGQALVGRLLKGCLDVGVVPQTEHRAVRLVTADGAVVGVEFETPDGPFTAHAHGGVVMATGGFEHDADLVRAFLRGPLQRAVSVPTNTGDSLKMAMRIGAGLANMREAWWVPTMDVPDADGVMGPWQVNGERTRPHSIIVNADGHRFTDEAANYNAFGGAFHNLDVARFSYVNLPAYLLFDHHYLSTYGIARHTAATPTPPWITEAATIGELADAIGVPSEELIATVARWNAHAVAGVDPDFHRGDSHHDRAWGDQKLPGKFTTLGPLDTPPYYAVQVYSGTLGTKGGPRTTADAQVIDVDGAPIPGLYAAGNTMASVFGMTYGGHGGTLGPAMIFGYRAGLHAAQTALETQAETRSMTSGVGS